MSTIDRLVMMANQIAANLATEDNPVAATAAHIWLFWDPRMKQIISAYDGAGLSITATNAISMLNEGV